MLATPDMSADPNHRGDAGSPPPASTSTDASAPGSNHGRWSGPARPRSVATCTQSEVSPSDPRFETPEDPRIPSGQEVFRIGEAARIVGVKPHVLRFWEGEFEWVDPEKTQTNQRRYRRADLARLLQIRRLRHEANLTVAQTRASIEEALQQGEAPSLAPRPSKPQPSRLPPHSTADAVELRRRLSEIRRAVVELLEAVED